MPDSDESPAQEVRGTKRASGQVSLAQMLKVLDKDVANGVERRLKKLSKKKGLKPVVNEQEVEQLNRKAAYEEAVQEVSKWEPIIEINREKNLSFPLDAQPDTLPTTADSIIYIKPRNDIEKEVQLIIDESRAVIAAEREKKKSEERYQKAISVDEAKERHLELQRTRVRLNEFAARMRRQKKIKSKSYHRLLKQERIKKHMKRVESDKDALMDEIERLQRIRAQERASLKHKNTGKWAKHAKFRAKYDDEARKLMLEQIGIASKRLEKPAMPEPDSDVEEDDDDNSEASEDETSINSVDDSDSDSEPDGVDVVIEDRPEKLKPKTNIQPIMSRDFVRGTGRKRQRKSLDDELGDGDDTNVGESEDPEEEQRKLMSEAFANDDVVDEFRKAKEQLADEEQPKDIDKYLPGWNDWAGPGIKVNEKRRQKFIKKAEKIDRKDESLNNVIISEYADSSISQLQPRQLPRGIRNIEHFKKVLAKPVTSTFTDRNSLREIIQPKIVTKMGSRIEPIDKRVMMGSKAGWS